MKIHGTNNGEIVELVINSNGSINATTLNSSELSSVNSSITPLNAGATFTGVAELNDHPDVMLTVKTDQNGTIYMDFSPDGNDWDSTLSFAYDTARINPPHILVKGYRYYRTRFTNTSASNQTYFRLSVSYGAFNKLTSPNNAVMAESYDATPTRPTHYQYEVATGKRQGRTTWNKYGYNDDIDIGTEMVWSAGGLFTRLNSASTFTIVSTSTQDKLTTGTGAWNVVVYYIDANRLAQVGVVALNGTTPVVTAFSGLGINRVALYNTGSSDINEGLITVTATTGGSTQAQIPSGEGSTQQAIFFTQANHTALMDFLFINVNKVSGGGSPKITIKAWVYSFVSTAKYLVFKDTIDTSVENHLDLNPKQPFVVGESSIIWFEATTDTNNSTVGVRFSLIEQRNS